MRCMKFLDKTLGSSALMNLVSAAAVVASMRGARRISAFYKEYRLEALGSRYAQLRVYLMRLDRHITLKNFHGSGIGGKEYSYPFSNALFSLSPSRTFAPVDMENQEIIDERDRISSFSVEFLKFLSESNIQTFTSNKGKRELWRAALKEMIGYLTILENLSYGIALTELELSPDERSPKNSDRQAKKNLSKKIELNFFQPMQRNIKDMLHYIVDYENEITKISTNFDNRAELKP